MHLLHGGVSAMGYVGRYHYNLITLSDRVPIPVLVIALVVLVIAFFGILSQFKSTTKGEGSPLDYVGLIIMLILFGLVALILTSGMIKGMRLL